MKEHWYLIHITECPICGSREIVRERQYTPAPPKHSPERYEYHEDALCANRDVSGL
jgi:hypothetical protein